MKNKKTNFKLMYFFIVGLILMGLILPLISATVDSQYTFNLSDRINIVISVCVLIGAVICFFCRMYLLSASLFIIMGILFLFNGLNIILSFIIIALGVIVAFKT